MDEQVLEILTEMNKEIKSFTLDMNEFKTEMNVESKSLKLDMNGFKTEMNNRFDKVEAQLAGVAGQFELTNESRIDEFNFISDKVNK